MDHEQHSNPRPPIRDWSTMTSSPTSGSARQLSRNKGLAWVSAITLGAGAASALGAAAIAISLPSPTAITSSTTAAVAASAPTSTSTNTGQDEGQGDDSGTTVQQAAPLQAVAAPTTTNLPPVATTGAS
jgi:hypothetical protein